jgi:hypothetical protein
MGCTDSKAEIECSDTNWVGLPRDKGGWKAFMNHRIPQSAGEFSSSYTTGSVRSAAELHVP